MTECVYEQPLASFYDQSESNADQSEMDNAKQTCANDVSKRRRIERVALCAANGRDALRDANERLGLALDAFDLDWYITLFAERMRRDPTHVELFDLAQSNSEHCRHYFFKALMMAAKTTTQKDETVEKQAEKCAETRKDDLVDVIGDGKSLMDLVRSTDYDVCDRSLCLLIMCSLFAVIACLRYVHNAAACRAPSTLHIVVDMLCSRLKRTTFRPASNPSKVLRLARVAASAIRTLAAAAP